MSQKRKPSYLQSLVSTTLLIALLVVTFPISLCLAIAVQLKAILSGSYGRSATSDASGRITVLVTGARTTKSLVLARIFWKAGYRVVLADERAWGRWSASRFSRCVSRYYDLPDPLLHHEAYEFRIRKIIQDENVSLWVPGSSAGATVNDARVAQVVRAKDGVQAFIQSPDEIEKLHNKDLFADLCKDLQFTVPESVLVTTVDEAVTFLHDEKRKGKQYILKTTALDDQGRSDLTRMPFSTSTKTRAHLQNIPIRITPSTPYVLQQYISGYEFCTHCHARDGVMQSFLTCPSSDMLMRYLDCRTSFSMKIARDAEEWTRDFLTRWKERLEREGKAHYLTGHFSFDFIVDIDGTLYPIECNPRIHTAIVLLSGVDAKKMAASYFGHKENGLIEPPAEARERYSWMFHALPIAFARAFLPKRLQHILHPLLARQQEVDPLGPQIPPITISPPDYASLAEVLMDYATGSEKDPLLDKQDPLPFLAQHIMWIWLLGRLVYLQRKGWSRVNVSTSRLFSC